MKRQRGSRLQKTGSVLAFVLLAIVVLTAMGAGVLSLGLGGRILAIRDSQQIQARCAADAGLTKAVFEMNRLLEARSWDPIALRYKFATAGLPTAADERLPSCDATLNYTVTASSTKAYSEFDITSAGQSAGSVKTVYATIKVKSIFDSAILVKDRISLMPNTLVLAYNSDDPTDTDIDLKIGTTSTAADRITLGPGSVIDGDVFAGVDGDPATVIGAGGTVNGFKFALEEEIKFPVITAPSLPNIGTSLYAKDTTVTIGPANIGVYTDITLENATAPGVLQITGGDVVLHITGNITLGKDCEVVVMPGSSLTIYVEGNVNADNSMGFNNNAGDVKDFALYATGAAGTQTFNLKAKGSIFGTVYAPHVDIAMYPGTEIHGALVGNNVTFKSGAAFYYDEALQEATVFEECMGFVIKRWREH
ncbi:MAG: DUF7305 domain-containing protein [Planctomycetota bacterium]|jgi:hypothetical protein